MNETQQKWSYIREYLGSDYTPEEVEMLFFRHISDWNQGDEYVLYFAVDKRAQQQFIDLTVNWYEVSPNSPYIEDLKKSIHL